MYWFRGEIALMMEPSDRQAIPSHWNPGASVVNPRSTTTSSAGVRAAAPGFRYISLQPQPRGAPRPAPGCAVFLRLELLPHRFQGGDGFAGDLPAAQGKRDGPAVDGGVMRSRTNRARRTSVILRSSCNMGPL